VYQHPTTADSPAKRRGRGTREYSPPVIVHLNGELLPLEQASISPLDRGFLLGDGLYEGLRAFGGHIVDLPRHARRLAQGLALARIPWDVSRLGDLCQGVLRANHLADAFIYMQVTRGVPAPGQPVRSRVLGGPVRPTVFAYATPTPPLSAYPPVPCKTAITVEDKRWLHGQAKSISLMGSVLAAIDAHEVGADDAILVRKAHDGAFAAEGTSANLIAVVERSGRREVVTPPLEHCPILAGVTRDLLLDACRGTELVITERPIRSDELAAAHEVMLCGTLTMVTAITTLDGLQVGNGKAGAVAERLLAALCAAVTHDGSKILT